MADTIELPSGAAATGLSDAQLRATPVPVSVSSGSISINGPVTISNEVEVKNDVGSPIPISATALPLPNTAATSTLQTVANSSLSSIDSKVPSGLTVTATRLLTDGSGVTQPVSVGNFPATQAVSGTVSVGNFPATQAISAASLPLPTGAATETTLSALNTKVTAVNTGAVVVASSALPSGAATETTLTALSAKIPTGLTVTSTRLLVDGSGVTQTVNGTVNVGNFPASQAVTGTFFQATQPVSIAAAVAVTGPLTDTQLRATPVPVSGTFTSTGLTDTQLRATAVPVSLTSTTISNFPATQAVSGTVTSNIGTTNGLALDSTLTGGTAKAIVRSAAKGTTVAADVTSTAVDANTQALDVVVKGIVATTLSGTPAVSVSNFPASQAVTGTFFQATQPVSGTVTANAGTGTFQTNITNASLPVTGAFFQATQPVSIAASVAVTGPLTDTQLRAAAVPVSLTSTTVTNTVAVSGTVTANIGTTNGLALDATLTSGAQKATVRSATKGTSTAADVTSTAVDANTQALDVFVKGTNGLTDTQLRATAVPVSLTSTTVTNTVAVSGAVTANAGTNLNTSLLALDSTVAKDASLTTLNTSVNSLLKPASTLAAVTAITNTVTIKADTAVNQVNALKVDGSAVTQPVSIAASVAVTGPLTDTQLRAVAVPVSLASTTVTNTVAVSGTVTANAGTGTFQTNITNASVPVTGTFFQATQPVSIAAAVAVTGPLTDTQLRATAVPVSLASTTITNFPATQAVSGTVSANIQSAGTTIGIRPDGFVRAQLDPTSLLFDTFETLDTTNTWTIGGTTAPTGVAGNLSVAPGTTASATSFAKSQPSFIPSSSGFLQFAAILQFEVAAVTGNQRVWGLGVYTTPTAAIPITNGSVFELDSATGALFGSVYSNSIRTQTIALTRPTDGLNHRYAIYYKASKVYFEIDNVSVGSIAFPNPQVSALSTVIVSANAGAALATAAVLTSTALGVGDTGRNATKLADGTYPWRVGKISAAGAQLVGIDQTTPGTTNLVSIGTTGTVAINAALPAGANVIGQVTANAGTNLNTSALALDTSVNTLLKPASTLAAVTTVSAVTAITNALPVGANVIGKVSIDQTTPGTTNLVALSPETTKVIGTVNLSAAQTLATVTTVGAVTAITNALPTGTNSIGTIQQAVLTKGTQGATGVTSQDLKDAGRNQTNYFMVLPIVTTATDALQSLTGFKSAAAVAATTTPAVVTAAKIYRINSVTITYVAVVTAGTAKFTLRANPAGVVAITSPAVSNWTIGGAAAVAGVAETVQISFPDGLEFPAGTGIGISVVGLSALQVAAAVGYAQISVQGYEY